MRAFHYKPFRGRSLIEMPKKEINEMLVLYFLGWGNDTVLSMVLTNGSKITVFSCQVLRSAIGRAKTYTFVSPFADS